MNKCIVCKKEFEGRSDAKFCGSTCRKRANRVTDNSENVTDNQISVTKPEVSVSNDVTATPDDVTLSAQKDGVINKWDVDLNPEKNPLKRITQIPAGSVDPDYYQSQTFKNLIEELETKSISQLTKEKYFIPAWKYAGLKKKPNIEEIFRKLHSEKK